MLTVYHVSYDLTHPYDYKSFVDGIRRCCSDRCYRILGSSWLIATTKSAKEVNDWLKNFLGTGNMFVSEVNENRQGWLPKGAWEWLKKNEPTEPEPGEIPEMPIVLRRKDMPVGTTEQKADSFQE
jgi:hypothetical protein